MYCLVFLHPIPPRDRYRYRYRGRIKTSSVSVTVSVSVTQRKLLYLHSSQELLQTHPSSVMQPQWDSSVQLHSSHVHVPAEMAEAPNKETPNKQAVTNCLMVTSW